nr:PREDICTED: BEN domain-containing protein 2 [Rhinolophus sinicus]
MASQGLGESLKFTASQGFEVILGLVAPAPSGHRPRPLLSTTPCGKSALCRRKFQRRFYYVVVTIDDSDDDNNSDVVIIEDSETELAEDTVPANGVLTIQPNSQGSSGNYQPPSEMSHEAEGLAGLDNQRVSQMNHPANLKRCNPNSAEVEFAPLNKKGHLSIPGKDDEEDNACGCIHSENHRNQLKELQLFCERMQDLMKSMTVQVNEFCGFFSKIQQSLEQPLLPNSASPALRTAVLPEEEPNLANTPETMNSATLMVNKSMGPDTASSSLCISPKLDMPKIAEIIVDNNPGIMNYPTSLGNDGGQCSSSLSVSLPPNSAENYLLIKLPRKGETSLENSSETMHYPASLGNISGPDTNCSLSISPNFGMPANAQISVKNNSQTMCYPALLGDNSGLATASSSVSILPNTDMLATGEPILASSTQMVNNPPSLQNDSSKDTQCVFNPSNFALIPIKVLAGSENGRENSHGTMTYPTVLENNNSQNSSSSSACNHYSFGFLGDPRRNIRILNFHLMAAQRKIEPRQAARYLVRVLFSKEVLICSSVGVNSYQPTCSGQQPLDPNKMAAIREYLAEVFPNHDLRECGKDWKACIAYINALIRYLCFYNTRKILGNTSVNNKFPTNPNTPVSAGLNDKKDGDGCESSFQLFQEAAASEMRANRNSQQNSSALPKGFIEPSIDDSKIPLGALTYVGNPSRNVQVPYEVPNTAKAKPCPELPARHLIRNMFPEDILMKSNVHGNVTHGTHALNPNRITTLREFLQDNYPNRDLREAGYDWKLCVTAINSCIRHLRHELNKSTSKSQPLPAMTP